MVKKYSDTNIKIKRDKNKCPGVPVNVPPAPLFWERDKRDTLL